MKEKIIESLAEPLKSINVEISDVEFAKEDGVNTLFIKIQSTDVVDTDLCEKASNIINPIIDSLDIEELKNEYVLDVCSKGENDE